MATEVSNGASSAFIFLEDSDQYLARHLGDVSPSVKAQPLELLGGKLVERNSIDWGKLETDYEYALLLLQLAMISDEEFDENWGDYREEVLMSNNG